MRNRSTAFIPIIGPGDNKDKMLTLSADKLLEAYAQQQNVNDKVSDQKAQDKNLNVIAIPLRHVGNLYKQGCTAVSAVHKLNLKTPSLAFYQRYKPEAIIQSQRLHSVTQEGSIEGQSAELGLAIVLLMNMSATRTWQIFATGALSQSEVGVEPNKSYQPYDVEVLPVKNIRRKLQLVLLKIKQGEFPVPAKGDEWLFFTPVLCGTEDNTVKVCDLPETHELTAQGVKVIPINWLSDVKRFLKIQKKNYLWQDRLIQVALTFTLLIMLIGSAWLSWINMPIKKSFVIDPFLACHPDGLLKKIPLDKPFIRSIIHPGERLGWQIQVEKTNGWSEFLSKVFGLFSYGNHVAFVIVFEHSVPRVRIHYRDGSGPIRIMPSEKILWWTALDNSLDNGILVILARHEPFDMEDIQLTIEQKAFSMNSKEHSKTGKMDIHAAVNALSKYDSHLLSFAFQVSNEGKKCMPSLF